MKRSSVTSLLAAFLTLPSVLVSQTGTLKTPVTRISGVETVLIALEGTWHFDLYSRGNTLHIASGEREMRLLSDSTKLAWKRLLSIGHTAAPAFRDPGRRPMLVSRTLAAAFSGITGRRMLGTSWERTRTNPIPSFWLGGPTAQGVSSCSLHWRSQAVQEPMCLPSSGSLMPSISSGSHRTDGGAQSSRGSATHNTGGGLTSSCRCGRPGFGKNFVCAPARSVRVSTVAASPQVAPQLTRFR